MSKPLEYNNKIPFEILDLVHSADHALSVLGEVRVFLSLQFSSGVSCKELMDSCQYAFEQLQSDLITAKIITGLPDKLL